VEIAIRRKRAAQPLRAFGRENALTEQFAMRSPSGIKRAFGVAVTAFSILVFTESMLLSGFFLKKKPPYIARNKSTYIRKLL
jgi:hypothetical protein